MRLKRYLFQWLTPVANGHSIVFYIALMSSVLLLSVPIINPNFSTLFWFFLLAVTTLVWQTYLLLRLAASYQENRVGIRGKLVNIFENTLFLLWSVSFVLVGVTLIKFSWQLM